tara:strand:+ start:432 stop:632 length:201 start_codon:yes stop_codon:yes gene_type:complete
MKNITLKQDEITTLQYAIHCARSSLARKKSEKATQEWIQSDGKHSDTHNIHMRNLWKLENKIHGRV